MKISCPVCSSASTSAVHSASAVPIFMNRVYASRDEARDAPIAQLDIVQCRDCGFGWNKAFDPTRIVYDESYENDQMHSPTFLSHVESRARDAISSVPDGEPIDLLEVGCGQGRFLSEIVRLAGDRLRSAEGFDPVWRGRDGDGPDGCRIHKVYFNDTTASRLRFEPNVVVSRHTIEHVPKPLNFLMALRGALSAQSQARLFLETPSFPWILKHGVIQDLFYEHCSIFSEAALGYALAFSGFSDVTVDHVFGDQYLWASARADVRCKPETPRGQEVNIGATFSEYVTKWRDHAVAARESGPVAVWGAGAKGVTFSMLVDPDGRLIDHVIDINPEKQGRYLGGSGLRVLSPEQSASASPETIFVMNPVYLTEIEQRLHATGSRATLVSVN